MAECSRPGCTSATRERVIPSAQPHRYCPAHHAEANREYRKTHPLFGVARVRMRARSMANTYLRRGKIQRKPCAGCGAPKAQMHHEDYSRPLDVQWLCRRCHMRHHFGGPLVDRPSPTLEIVDTAPKSVLCPVEGPN